MIVWAAMANEIRKNINDVNSRNFVFIVPLGVYSILCLKMLLFDD